MEEGHPPRRYDDLLFQGDSKDGHDHRGNIALYQSLGFTWVIADYIPELLRWSMKRGQLRGGDDVA